MTDVRIISDPRDSSRCPTTRTLSDALSKLADWSELPAESTVQLLARSAPGRPARSSALFFRSSKGDEALFALPISQGCRATSTLGTRFYMTLDCLDGAEADCDGNVRLRDGTYVHGVSFDVLKPHFELPELEETIVYLTIRYLKAEAQCLRNDYGFVGIDYSALPHLRVSSVKALALYVNAALAAIPRRNSEDPPLKEISEDTIQETLNLVGIRKARGRPRRDDSAPQYRPN